MVANRVEVPDRPPRIRSLAPQRVRARSAILAAIALVIALTAGIVVATTGYLEVATTAGARQIIDGAPTDASSVSIDTHLAEDDAAQTAAADAVITERFAGTPVESTRILRAGLLSSQTADGEASPDLFVIADPALADVAELVSGAWPEFDAAASGPIPAAIQADAASALALEIGDELRVGSSGQQVTLTIAATWRAIDPTDPRFGSEPSFASGETEAALGPVVVGPAALVTLPAGHFVRWTITPVIDELTTASIDALVTSAEPDALAEEIRRAGGVIDESMTVAGNLSVTAARVTSVASAASAVSSIPLALTGAIALITLLQLSTLLAGARRGETYMFRARGASAGQLARWSALEAFVVVLPAAVIGGAAGLLVANRLGAPLVPTWLQIAATVLVVIVAFVAVAVRGALAAHAGASVAGRSSTGALSVVLIVLAVLAAGLSTWQLLLYGPGTVSPLAALAPTLGVAAIALVLGALLAPIAAILSRVLARLRTLIPALAARQVARQAGVFAVASLVVALATGGVTVATAISGQIARVDKNATALSTGSDVRVSLAVQGQISDGTEPVTAERYADLPGSTAATVVLATAASIGNDSIDLVGITRESLETVESATGFAATPLPEDFGAGTTPVALPDDARDLSVTIASTAAAPERPGGVRVQAWLADATGALAKVDLGVVEFADPTLGDGATVTGELPAGIAPWGLLAIDTSLVGAPSAAQLTITIQAIAADSAVLDADLGDATISSSRTTDRSLLDDGVAEIGDAPMGVVITEALAIRAGFTVGDTFDLGFSTGRTLPATVIGTAPGVPGTSAELGVLVDLIDLDAVMLADRGPVLQAADVWITSSDPEATARDASLVSRYPASVRSAGSASVAPLLDPTVQALVVDLAGVVLIAIIAFGATAATLARSRKDEAVVLGALGMTARGQAALRGLELATVTLFAALTGIIAGVLAAILCAGMLAASAVPGSAGGFAVPPFGAAVIPVAGLLVALLLVVAGYALVVGRSLALRRARRVAAQPVEIRS